MKKGRYPSRWSWVPLALGVILFAAIAIWVVRGVQQAARVSDQEGLRMAKQAIDRGTGARALRSIFERLMLDIMYQVPSDKSITGVTLTEAAVLGKGKPKLTHRGKKA